MSQVKLEKVVLDTQQTVLSLVKKVDSLEKVILEQNNMIKSQSEIISQLIQLPTRKVSEISAPSEATQAPKQRPPSTRAASIRAVLSMTGDRKKTSNFTTTCRHGASKCKRASYICQSIARGGSRHYANCLCHSDTTWHTICLCPSSYAI